MFRQYNDKRQMRYKKLWLFFIKKATGYVYINFIAYGSRQNLNKLH